MDLDVNSPPDVKGNAADEKKIEDLGDKKLSSDGEVEANAVEIAEQEARRILSKVDWRLVPVLSLLYLVAFVDRSNSEAAPRPGVRDPAANTMQSAMRRLQGSPRTSTCTACSTTRP